VYILFPTITSQDITTCTHRRHSTRRPPRHNQHVSFYTIWTQLLRPTVRTIWPENNVPRRPFFPLIGQGPNRRRTIPKTSYHVIDHVVYRKSDLSLFISILSNITDCTLVHWPSQQDMIDASAVDTQKHPVIGLTG